jgi:hypothetical protein
MPLRRTVSLSRRGLLAGGSALLGAAAALGTAPARAAPEAEGQWSPVHGWPDVAIHLHLLRDGKVLTFADDDNVFPPDRLAGSSKAFVATIPADGAPLTTVVDVPNHQTNLFCAGHTFLPDGRLFVIGGHEGEQYAGAAEATILEHDPYRWSRQPQLMNAGRWYGTAVLLGSGEVLALSGTIAGSSDINPMPQVWRTNGGGGWRNLTGALKKVPPYPRCALAPNGRVYVAGTSQATHYLDTAGTGRWTGGPRRLDPSRTAGACVLYDAFKLLMVGGGRSPPLQACERIDLAAGTPRWTRTGAMAFARRHCNGVLLPDGTVLAVGGTSGDGNNNAAGRVLVAESWNPATGVWTRLASMAVPRLYHSSAMLLPDGRVLVAGGGRGSGGVDYENAQIYSPPYLFRGPRPAITSAPATVGYGQALPVGTSAPADVTGAVLIKCASTTHDNNMSQGVQRFRTPARTAGGISVKVTSNRHALPPGHYMLFVLAGGVPSRARIIRVG